MEASKQMIDKDEQASILAAISQGGRISTEELKLNSNIEHVLSLASGSPRIQSSCLRHAKLILSRPAELNQFHAAQIRCVLCRRQICYPAWYYKLEFAVNQFHYFICFDSEKSGKPTVKCYRRI